MAVGSAAIALPLPASAAAPVPDGYDCFPLTSSRLLDGVDRIWIEVNGRGGAPDSAEPYVQLMGLAASLTGWYPVDPGDTVGWGSPDVMPGAVVVNGVLIVVAGSGGEPGWYYDPNAGGIGTAGGDAGLPGETAEPGAGAGGGGGAGIDAGGAGGTDGAAPAGSAGTPGTGGEGGAGGGAGRGGRGGDGLFGGGGGAASTTATPGSGGGGGSSYVAEGFQLVGSRLIDDREDFVPPSVTIEQCVPRPGADAERIAAVEAAGYECAAPVPFALTGSAERFTVPADARVALIDTYGASGGDASGWGSEVPYVAGRGGATSAVIDVTPGEVLEVRVGGRGEASFEWGVGVRTPVPGGYNGGGGAMLPSDDTPVGATGGGASDVRRAPFGLDDRIVVAGGGGGGAYGLRGGDGGPVGGDGEWAGDAAIPEDVFGTGATSSAPGVNGVIQGQVIPGHGPVSAAPGAEPTAGLGGSFLFIPPPAPYENYGDGFSAATGGGGGWFGGGAGGGYVSADWRSRAAGAAGGGSSYAIAGSAALPETRMDTGIRYGDGLVYITTCSFAGGLAPTGGVALSPLVASGAIAAAVLGGIALVAARRRRAL